MLRELSGRSKRGLGAQAYKAGGGCRWWKKMALVEKRRRRRHRAGQPVEGLGRGESPASRAPGEGRGCVGTPEPGGRAGMKGG